MGCAVQPDSLCCLDSGIYSLMETEPLAAGISTRVEQSPDGRLYRWLILAALPYYLCQAEAFPTLSWHYLVSH